MISLILVHATKLRRASILEEMKEKEEKNEKNIDLRRPESKIQQTLEIPECNHRNTVFAFTKIIWMINSKNTIEEFIIDKDGKYLVLKYLSLSSLLLKNGFDFLCEFFPILNSQVNNYLLIC